MTLNLFFGRADEMQRLLDLLQPQSLSQGSPPPLVTLMGLGGTGKTRLATEIARRALERNRTLATALERL